MTRWASAALTVIATVLACLGAPSPAPAAVDNTSMADSSAHVTYVTGDLIYVDAGRQSGLGEGLELQVERDGKAVATLKVEHLSSHQASCSVIGDPVEVKIGDVVRFRPVPAKTTGENPSPAASRANPGRTGSVSTMQALRALGFRGRVGVRYLTLMDQTGSGAGFSQPALDLRVSGTRINGSDLDLLVDARARRTYRTDANGGQSNDGRTRFYRLSLSRRAEGSPLRLSLGRQVSPDLASVSLFDGLLGEYARRSVAFGVFTGTQPDPKTYGASSEVFEYGGYARVQGAQAGVGRWALTGGAIQSLVRGAVNRDYLFLRGRYMNRRMFGYLTQEIDINRGWKAKAGEPLLTPTSTYLNLRYQPAPALSFTAGFDNRRNVRLYRDRDTPETVFDDSYRRGLRGGVSVRFLDRFRVGGDAGIRGGGGSGDSKSFTFTTRISRLSPLAVDLSTRHTRYTGPLADGWLHTVRAGGSIGRRNRLELHAGGKREDRFTGPETSAQTTWLGADLDLGIVTGWYLLLSGESTRGDVEKNDQVYTSLSYRF